MSDFSLINAALTRTGNAPITSFTDGTAEADTAAANYEEVVGRLLGAHPWRFAKRTAPLNRLSDPAPAPWAYLYQLPTDILLLRDVRAAGRPVDWTQHGTRIATDAAADLVATYTWRVPEVQMPPFFREVVTVALEALFLRALGERYAEGQDRQGEMERSLLPTAKRLDSQAARQSDPVDYPIMRVRRSG